MNSRRKVFIGKKQQPKPTKLVCGDHGDSNNIIVNVLLNLVCPVPEPNLVNDSVRLVPLVLREVEI